MIAQMDRVELVFLRSAMKDLVPYLQNLGTVHLEDVPLAMENHPGYLHRVHLPEEQQQELAQLREVQDLLKEALPLLSTTPSHGDVVAAGPGVEALGLSGQRSKARGWHRRIRSLSRRRLNIEDNIVLIQHYSEVMKALLPLLAEKKVELGKTARAMVLESYSQEAIDALTKRFINEVGPECDLIQHGLGRNSVVAVVTHGEGKDDAVSAVLEAEGLLSLRAPDSDIKGASPSQVMDKISAKLGEMKGKLDIVSADIAAFAQEHGAALTALNQVITTRIEELGAPKQFAQSKMVGVIHGWVPTKEYDALEQGIKKEFGAAVAMEKLSKEDVEITRVPTLLENHAVFKPFQLIMKMFNPPTYGHFDPTWLVAVSFITFYGFILGDFGYGAFIMAVCYWAKKKWGHNEMVADAMTIAMWMGASSIVWGILYMEGFGNFFEIQFGLHPIFLHRAHDTMALLNYAFLYGVFHIPLALILGIVGGYKHGHKHHAEEKLGMLLGLAAVGLIVTGIMGLIPQTLGFGLAAVSFFVGLGFLVKSMGVMAPMGVLEILGLTANILSYGRLMALGMASVALADLANELIYNTSGGMLIIGTVAAGFIHLMNIGIGVFSPTIHSLRLNYVEFLPKFYEPEGRNYTPFRKGVAW